MNKIKIMMQSMLWLCVTCFSLLVGCVHEDLSAVASVDEAVVTVDASVNNYSYTVTANANWTLVSDADWCVPSATSGSGTTTINLFISANTTSVERSTVMTLACGGNDTKITVIQSGVSTSIEVSPSTHTIDMNANTVYVAVMSNTAWTAVASDSWTTINGSSSYTDTDATSKIIAIDCEANELYADRQATIQFIVAGSESITKEVTISQLSQGAPAITLATESVNIAAAGGSVNVAYISNIDFIAASSDATWCSVEVQESTDNIKITATQNSTTSSRSTIVTVVGFVGGEENTTQIIVTQAGSASPSITLLNSTVTLSALDGSNATISFVADCDVTIGHSDSWITTNPATGKTATSSFTVTATANASEDARVGTVELIATSTSSNEVTYYYVTVNQEGTGAVSLSSTPSLFALSSAGGASLVYLVSTGDVTINSVVSSNEWLTVSNTNGSVEFSYIANISDAMRDATISVNYSANGSYYMYSIPVVQNGLGSPEISCVDNVIMETVASTESVFAFSSEANITNIALEVVSISYTLPSTAGTSFVDWLTATAVNDNSIELTTTSTNTDDNERYATVTFKATRGNSVVYKTITVTQLGHLSAGVDALDQEIFVNYEAADYDYVFLALNNSTVAVVNYPTWAVATVSSTDSAYTLNVDVEVYNGADGDFREGYITLSASNGNSTVTYYDILVRQYSQAAAMVEGITELSLTHDAYSGVALGLNLLNGSSIDGVVVTASEGSTSGSSWLTASVSGDDVTFSADQFLGPEESRTGVISITVSNENQNAYVHTITVTQYLAEPTTITATETIAVEYNATTADLTYNTTGSGTVEVVGTSSGVANIVFNATQDPTAITFSQNTSLEEQVSTIQLVATSVDNNITAETTITLIQKAAPATTLEVSEFLTAQAVGETIQLVYSATGYDDLDSATTDVTVSAIGSESWIAQSVTAGTENDTVLPFTLDANTATEERTATITVTAKSATTGSTVTKSVTVTQAGSGDAILTVIPNVSYDYKGASSILVTPTLMANAELVSVESSESWVSYSGSTTLASSGDTSFTYDVAAYDGADGDTRIATIVVKAVSEQGKYATSTITVTQTAPEAITISAVSVDGAAAYDASQVTATLRYQFGGYASTATVDAAYSDTWLKATSDTDSSNGYFTFELDNNTSSSPRTATILLTAYDGASENASTATTTVTITQLGASATTLVVPANISVAATDVSANISYSTAGDGDITVTAAADDLTMFAASSFTGASNVLPITLSANTDSAARTGTLVVTATSATGQSVSEVVTVTQAGTGEAMISTLSEYSYDYTGTSAVTVAPVLSENTYLESVTSSATWVTVSSLSATASTTGKDTSFTFEVGAYDGAEGATRIATIEVVAWNGGSLATSYITITQTAPEALTLSVPESVTMAYASGSTTNIAYIATSTGTVTLDVAVEDDATFTATTPTTIGTNGVIAMSATSTNTGSAVRTTMVTITATDDVSTDVVTKTVILTQEAPEPLSITAVSAVSVGNTAGDSATILHEVAGDGTPTYDVSVDDVANFSVSESGGVITVEAVGDNDTNTTRTATVKITVSTTDASAESASAYVTVSQVGTGDAIMGLVSNLEFTYAEVTAAAVSPDLATNTTLSTVTSSADWLSIDNTFSAGATSFTYSATANTSTETRIATITVVAKSADDSVVTSYISVAQTGVEAIALATAESVTAAGGDATTNPTVAVSIPYSVSGTDSANATISAEAYSGETSIVNSAAQNGANVDVELVYNPTSESRSVVIAITATGSASNSTSDVKYVTINQQGTGSATIIVADAIDLTYEGTSKEITITPTLGDNAIITSVTSSASWLEIDSSDVKDTYFAYSADANTTGETRYATITIVAESGDSTTSTTIIVTQTAPAAITLVAAPASYDVASSAATATGSQTIIAYYTASGEVESSYGIEVKADASVDWISAKTADALSSEIKLTIDDNTSTESRTAEVALVAYATGGSNGTTATQIITITQAATTTTVVSVTASTDDVNISATTNSTVFSVNSSTTSGGSVTLEGKVYDSLGTEVSGATVAFNGSAAIVSGLPENTTTSEVSYYVVITGTDSVDTTVTGTETVIITQAAATVDYSGTLVISSQSYSVDATSTTAGEGGSKQLYWNFVAADPSVTAVTSYAVSCVSAEVNGSTRVDMVNKFNAITNTISSTDLADNNLITFPENELISTITYYIVLTATMPDGSTITSNTLTYTQATATVTP